MNTAITIGWTFLFAFFALWLACQVGATFALSWYPRIANLSWPDFFLRLAIGAILVLALCILWSVRP